MHIRTNIKPGDIGYITYLHGSLYAAEYGLDHTFEGYVAAGIGEFAQKYDANKDYFAVAELDGTIVGAIAIVGQSDQTAQLRWFLVDPDARGRGLGKRLLRDAVDFCRQRNYNEIRGRGEFAGRGWTVSRALVLIFPGTRDSANPFMTSDRIEQAARMKFEAWGGMTRLKACVREYEGH